MILCCILNKIKLFNLCPKASLWSVFGHTLLCSSPHKVMTALYICLALLLTHTLEPGYESTPFKLNPKCMSFIKSSTFYSLFYELKPVLHFESIMFLYNSIFLCCFVSEIPLYMSLQCECYALSEVAEFNNHIGGLAAPII